MEIQINRTYRTKQRDSLYELVKLGVDLIFCSFFPSILKLPGGKIVCRYHKWESKFVRYFIHDQTKMHYCERQQPTIALVPIFATSYL